MTSALEIDPLLSPLEVADILKVSRTGVYRLIESGEVPCLRIRGQYRFERSAIAEYIRGQTGSRVVRLHETKNTK